MRLSVDSPTSPSSSTRSPWRKPDSLEQLTPLRLGVVAPDTAVVQLKAQRVTLRGLATARSATPHPQRPMLKAVAPMRRAR